MSFSLNVALRFLKSNKGQTILIALGIAIGISVQIFIGLLIRGLQDDLVNTTIGNSSQVSILPGDDNEGIEDYNSIISKVEKLEEPLAVTPVISSPLFIIDEDKSESVLLRSMDIDKGEGIYKWKDKIVEGDLPKTDSDILIGIDLAKTLDVSVSDEVEVKDAKGNSAILKISGVFDLKVSRINQSWIVSKLELPVSMLGYKNQVSIIEMQLKDVFNATNLALLISDELEDYEVSVQDWQTENEQLLSGLNGQSVSSIMIQVFVLIAVVLGISSVLAITVMQKSRQIGILKAMGIKDNQASYIFLFQGMLLGIIGSLLGILLGVLLIVAFQTFAKNPDGTPVIEIKLETWFIIVSGMIGIVSSMVASLIPARKSSKLNPIEVIKNG